MTYKRRTFLLMAVTLGAAFNFLPASRAATIDQTDALRITIERPNLEAESLQAPWGQDVDCPRCQGAGRPRGDDTPSPRGEDPRVPRGGGEK